MELGEKVACTRRKLLNVFLWDEPWLSSERAAAVNRFPPRIILFWPLSLNLGVVIFDLPGS